MHGLKGMGQLQHSIRSTGQFSESILSRKPSIARELYLSCHQFVINCHLGRPPACPDPDGGGSNSIRPGHCCLIIGNRQSCSLTVSICKKLYSPSMAAASATSGRPCVTGG